MTEQQANHMFNEELGSFQRNTQFSHERYTPELHEYFLKGLRYFSPVKLGVVAADFNDTLDYAASRTMFEMGLILRVMENTSAFQLDIDLGEYAAYIETVETITQEYRNLLDPEVTRINRKIQTMHQLGANGKKVALPIGKA